MAERDKARVIVPNHVDGAGTKPKDETQESVLLFDLRRPAIQVATERNSRRMGEVIPPCPFTFHKLNQDADAFVVIRKLLDMTIHQRIGI